MLNLHVYQNKPLTEWVVWNKTLNNEWLVSFSGEEEAKAFVIELLTKTNI
jgi:hypothetical protein